VLDHNVSSSRNPTWSRDELIVTLDFYLRHRPTIPGKQSREILDLSNLLNSLQSKVGGFKTGTFRNANGVYMKLMNFRRFDPDYTGKGLERGGKDEEVIWNLFAPKPSDLRNVADAIRSYISSNEHVPPPEIILDDEEEGQEGQILTRTHRYRERDPVLVQKKKARHLRENNSLVCQACGFDFKKTYGDHGSGFIECHHTKPVSELIAGAVTKLSDLALICSNCHRMIHRKRPWLSVEQLREILRSQKIVGNAD
jgi:5-methylcytosine-specific restriction protein A